VADILGRIRLEPSSLVVLSACRTGIGEVVAGEGVIGLGWSFLRAGARGIVVSHWTVEDASAARLMIAFHRRLAAATDPVRALAEAAREIQSLGPEYRHPAHWAPFVIVLRPG
jgi:CHAT domain-containing protein